MSNTGLTPVQTTSLLLSVVGNNNLRQLNLHSVRLSEVPAPLLGQLTTVVTQVDLTFTKMTPRQVTELLTACTDKRSSLKDLSLRGADLASVDPHLIGRSVATLNKINMKKPTNT